MKKSTNQQKKILVTGGAGYVGSVLVSYLVESGFPVRVFDRMYFGKQGLSSCENMIEIIKGDIRIVNKKVFSDIFAVIHLAGLSNDPTADFSPKTNHEINTLASISLAQKAKEYGVKRFIFASSCSLYDKAPGKNKEKNESDHVIPRRPYSVSKREAEKKLLRLADNMFCVSILRKGTVYGFSPRMRFDLVINSMVKDALQNGYIRMYNNGLQLRPLIDITDVARAYVLLLTADERKINKQIYNLSFANFLIKDVANAVKEVLYEKYRISIPIISEKSELPDRSYAVATQKIKKDLGFIPKVSIQDSVIHLVQELRARMINFDDPIHYNIDWMKQYLSPEE